MTTIRDDLNFHRELFLGFPGNVSHETRVDGKQKDTYIARKLRIAHTIMHYFSYVYIFQ